MKMPTGHKNSEKDMVKENMKKMLLAVYICLISSYPFFAAGKPEPPPVKVLEPEIQHVVSDKIQKLYDAMGNSVPAVIMLPCKFTSAVEPEISLAVQSELPKQLVLSGRYKPVFMTTHLATAFGRTKAQNPFGFVTALRGERYSQSLQGFFTAYIFKNADTYVLSISYYPFRGSLTQTQVFRFFSTAKDLPGIVKECIDELYFRIDNSISTNKKRILIRDFQVDFRKLVELESGEFDFISSPFIMHNGVQYRAGDDYFSVLLGYQLSSTFLFETVMAKDFSEYANSSNITAAQIDYILTGDVILTDQYNLLRIALRTPGGRNAIVEITYPFQKSSVYSLWEVYREITQLIVLQVFNNNEYGVVNGIENEGCDFFLNNVFIGRDSIDPIVLPRGSHTITTKPYKVFLVEVPPEELPEDAENAKKKKGDSAEGEYIPVFKEVIPDAHTFYILIGEKKEIYLDKEGAYVWNLLQK